MPDSILRVMEIDLSPSDDMENRLSRLCSNALAINGTVLCFDVTDMASFTRIESVIREHIPLATISMSTDNFCFR